MPIIQRLFAQLDPSILRGTVVGVPVVSAYAFNAATRTFFEGFDLNRIMPGNPSGNVGQVYAHRILDRLVRHFDFLVDVHTASFGRVNSLYVRADLRHAASRKMAFLQAPEIIVHNEAKDGTLRDAAMDMGISAITVEVGDPLRFQRRMIRDSLDGVRAILHEYDFLPDAVPEEDDEPPVVCASSKWIYADGGGLLEVLPDLAALVRKGEPIARLRNPFGDILATYEAPHEGVIVGKSTNPVCRTGSRIVHLGSPTDPTAFDPA
ncbi:MAG: succinylglutamate desuccinylase/aspartoacylase family protein [Nannocystaceae bacterium]